MAWDFKVGDQVVCIDAALADGAYFGVGSKLTAGEVYTITEIGWSENWMPKGPFRPPGLCLRLLETKNIHRRYKVDMGYGVRRFRPLTSWSLDSLLTLTVPPEPKEVEHAEH